MQEGAGLTPEQQPEAPKRGKRWWTAGIIVLLLVMGGLATGYARYDWLKDPRTVYLEAEWQSVQQVSRFIGESYDRLQSRIDPYLSQPYRSQTDITEIRFDGAPADPYQQMVLKLLQETGVSVVSMNDDASKRAYTRINLRLKDQELFGIEAFADEEKLGFGVPAIYGKYAVIHWNDVDAISQTYQVQLPKKLLSYRDILDAVTFSEAELSDVLRPYARLYADSITDRQVSLNRNARFERGEVKQNVREITVTFSEAEWKQLVKKMTDAMMADGKLHDLLYSRYRNVASLLADSGYAATPSGIASKESFVHSFQSNLRQFAASVEQDALPGGVIMVLQVDDRDRILGRTVTLHPEDREGKVATISTGRWEEPGGEEKWQLTLSAKQNETVLTEFTVTYAGISSGQKKKGTFEVYTDGQDPSRPARMSATWDVAKDGNRTSGSATLVIRHEENGVPESVSVTVQGASVDVDDNRREGEYDVKLQADAAASAEVPQSIGFKLRLTEELGVEVKTPGLTSANSLNLATASDQDVQQMQADLQAGFQQFVQKHMGLFRELGIVP